MRLPVPQWASGYRRESLGGDIVAGLTVAAAAVPGGLAYAQLAGLPAVHGLYASILPALLYAVVGTSRQLQMGPGATLSILVATSLGGLAFASDPDQAAVSAAVMALVAGGLLLLGGVLRLGFLSGSVIPSNP